MLLVPRDDDAALRARLADASRRRLARILARWAGAPRARLGRLDRTVLASGPFRAWLASVEDALETRGLAEAASAAPPSGVRWSRLLDRVADLGELPALAPSGSLPRDFPRRALSLASRELKRHGRSLARVLRVANEDVRDPRAKLSRLVRAKGARIEAAAVRRFASRVPPALALLETAWPDASRMVVSRLHAVVPIDDRAVVSWSSAREPGIAYVHVRSSPVVRLAEDLLHETTHMRVHEIETLDALVRPPARGAEEPRFYSPWRREWRPLRGLLHGACTFTVGARFFERMLAGSEPGSGAVRFAAARRAWLARRFLEEMESTRVALRTLASPRARSLLTGAGREVIRAARRERAALLPAAHARKRFLARAARAELHAFEGWRRALGERPFRSEVHRLGSL